MTVLCSHHEDVAGVWLQVGHGVGLGVDSDGGHHPASLQVTAVVLDGVANQRRGSIIRVLPPRQGDRGGLPVHHPHLGRGAGEGGGVRCAVEDDVWVLGILHSDVG